MRTFQLAIAVLAILIASTVAAQNLPRYYKDADFKRTGRIDSVQLEEQRIVIDDISYSFSSNVIVHSPRAYNVATSNLKVGTTIGYKFLNVRARQIGEIWLLPNNYNDRAGRR